MLEEKCDIMCVVLLLVHYLFLFVYCEMSFDRLIEEL
jgi:hypothetical protein